MCQYHHFEEIRLASYHNPISHIEICPKQAKLNSKLIKVKEMVPSRKWLLFHYENLFLKSQMQPFRYFIQLSCERIKGRRTSAYSAIFLYCVMPFVVSVFQIQRHCTRKYPGCVTQFYAMFYRTKIDFLILIQTESWLRQNRKDHSVSAIFLIYSIFNMRLHEAALNDATNYALKRYVVQMRGITLSISVTLISYVRRNVA